MAAAFTAAVAEQRPPGEPPPWPEGSEVVPFENLEGIVLVEATLTGVSRADTTGLLALDSGAGFLVLDHQLAVRLGLADGPPSSDGLDFADRPLPRLEIGSLQSDLVQPVLTVDLDIVRRVADRAVLGLIGQRVVAGRAVFVDYQAGRMALVPIEREASSPGRESAPEAVGWRADRSRAVLGALVGAGATAVPFELAGDGKMLIRVRVSNPRPPRFSAWLTLILDTGATKCVLFEEALDERVPGARRWPAVDGLSAPTLMGSAEARITRVPMVEVDAGSAKLRVTGVDAAVIRSGLSGRLARAVGEPVHGLIGYSFLRRYRFVIDYPHRILWLDPLPPGWDERPFEYSHVGLQLERRAGAARVMAVAAGSPAARAGIGPGDEIVAIDGEPAARLDLASLARRLEGPPGSRVTLRIRRGTSERTYVLARRRLL